jgi:hypothetical protein
MLKATMLRIFRRRVGSQFGETSKFTVLALNIDGITDRIVETGWKRAA